MPQIQYDAFISYKRGGEDETFARELKAKLESEGYTIAFDEEAFLPHLPFLEELERCVKESRFTVAIVSPRYFESGNTQKEARIRTVLDMAKRTYCLIPVVIEEVERPIWMYELTSIDAKRADRLEHTLIRLKQSLGNPL